VGTAGLIPIQKAEKEESIVENQKVCGLAPGFKGSEALFQLMR
jgi:hypothetical protein